MACTADSLQMGPKFSMIVETQWASQLPNHVYSQGDMELEAPQPAQLTSGQESVMPDGPGALMDRRVVRNW